MSISVNYKVWVIPQAKVFSQFAHIFYAQLQRNRILFPYLILMGFNYRQHLGNLVMIFMVFPIIVGGSSSMKVFTQCFTQPTTTSSKILHIGDFSVAIFNPANLKIGIFKFSTSVTTNFITITGNPTTYVQGNYIYNRYGAQGIANREMFTLVGDQFYDSTMLAYSGAPKIWKIIGGEYVVKLMPDNILWLSHWRNIKYMKVCNISSLNMNSSIISLTASQKQELFLFFANWQVVRLFYNQTADNYTAQVGQLFSFATSIEDYVISSDSTCFFYHYKVSSIHTRIYKFAINKQVFSFTIAQNFTLQMTESISKISYSENKLNFIVLLSNSSFRVCGFSWGTCYHLTGTPAESISPNIQSSDYLVKDFKVKNLTQFGLITLNNQFKVYNTSEFQDSNFMAEQQWPDGAVDSQPLSEIYQLFNQTLPDYQYPSLEISEEEEGLDHLSRSTVILVYIISLPQSRKVLVFLNPLYMLLQNFWLYNYQNKNFRPVVNRTLSIMRIINQVKLFPLPFYSVENDLKSSVNFNRVTSSDFTQLSPPKFVQIEGNDVSFLKNIQDSFIWGSLYAILSFILTKILSKIPFKSKAVRQFFKSKSHNGTLFTSLIQSNIQFYTFMGFSQLKLTGQLQMGDKYKIVAAVIILFVVIIYSIAGFMIVAGLWKKCWSVFIEDRDEDNKKSLYFSVIWLTLQNLITGFANGFFQENAVMLQIMIIGIDASSLACVLFFWSTAQSYVSNILLTLYIVFKLLFDIVIYDSEIDQWVESLLIAAIILTILYSVFWNISITYKDSCQIFIQINKNSLVKTTSRQLPPLKSKRQHQPAQALESQIIFNTKNKIEGSVDFKQQPKPIERKLKFAQKTRQFFSKIVNSKGFQNQSLQKKFLQKKTLGQVKTAKSLKRNKGKLQNCVSGKISTGGEIQLQAPEKNVPQIDSELNGKEANKN